VNVTQDAAIRALARKVSEVLKGERLNVAILAQAIVLSYSISRVRADRRDMIMEAAIAVVMGLAHLPDFPDTPEEPLQ
jgi:hypothetical protein